MSRPQLLSVRPAPATASQTAGTTGCGGASTDGLKTGQHPYAALLSVCQTPEDVGRLNLSPDTLRQLGIRASPADVAAVIINYKSLKFNEKYFFYLK